MYPSSYEQSKKKKTLLTTQPLPKKEALNVALSHIVTPLATSLKRYNYSSTSKLPKNCHYPTIPHYKFHISFDKANRLLNH